MGEVGRSDSLYQDSASYSYTAAAAVVALTTLSLFPSSLLPW